MEKEIAVRVTITDLGGVVQDELTVRPFRQQVTTVGQLANVIVSELGNRFEVHSDYDDEGGA